MNNHNKKVLSRSLLYAAGGLALLGISFLGYRITTPVPNSTLSGAGVFFRAAIPLLLACLCAVAANAFYKAITVENYTGGKFASEKPRTHTPAEPAIEPVAELPSEEPGTTLIGRDKNSKLLRRINDVMEQSYTGVAALAPRSAVYANDKDLDPVAFDIVAEKAGSFSDSGTVSKLFNSVTQSIPKGKILWGMEPNIVEDILTFKKKKPFKKMIFPKTPETVVKDAEHALSMYKGMKFKIGEDVYGNIIEIDPKRAPHGLIIGGTGAGKSVFTRGLIEDLRAQGWQIVIVDGKKSDYVGMVNVPNVIAVGGKLEDWVRLIEFVNDNVEARYERAADRKRKGQTPEFDQPPMLFLVDETGSVMRDIKSKYGNKGFNYVNNILKNIAAKARQAKVHMFMAAQDAYNTTFDGDLKANLSFRVSLGTIEDRTVKDAFSEEARPEAKRIGQSITKEDAGRGIIEIQDEKKGTTVVEFQSYFAYSPGNEDGIPDKDPIKTAWTDYKENVSDKIPRLYPRIWWEEPEPDDLRKIESPEVLNNYRAFSIQDAQGNIKPSLRQYDRMDDDYVGFRTSGGGSAAAIVGFDMGASSGSVAVTPDPAGDDDWDGKDTFDVEGPATTSVAEMAGGTPIDVMPDSALNKVVEPESVDDTLNKMEKDFSGLEFDEDDEGENDSQGEQEHEAESAENTEEGSPNDDDKGSEESVESVEETETVVPVDDQGDVVTPEDESPEPSRTVLTPETVDFDTWNVVQPLVSDVATEVSAVSQEDFERLATLIKRGDVSDSSEPVDADFEVSGDKESSLPDHKPTVELEDKEVPEVPLSKPKKKAKKKKSNGLSFDDGFDF